MNSIRFSLALWISKLSVIAINIIAKGRGTNLPGQIALRIDPHFVKHIKGADPEKCVFSRKQVFPYTHRVREIDSLFFSKNLFPEWERKELQKRGSDIIFFPYTKEQSSSKIRKSLMSER